MQRRNGTGRAWLGERGWGRKGGRCGRRAVGEGSVRQGSGADKATAALVGVADKKADGAQPLDPRTGVERKSVSGGGVGIVGRHCPEANRGGGLMGQGMVGQGFRGLAAGRLFPGGADGAGDLGRVFVGVDDGAGMWGGAFRVGMMGRGWGWDLNTSGAAVSGRG
ncbi:hypothetical protein B0H14DRAFT_2657213 [Mycena olivaceomarginata]|nr:hypothetical protein B0H14DRAFT_2657213 [Mycena olivaceomarginata]